LVGEYANMYTCDESSKPEQSTLGAMLIFDVQQPGYCPES